jgi:hypothetical protein
MLKVKKPPLNKYKGLRKGYAKVHTKCQLRRFRKHDIMQRSISIIVWGFHALLAAPPAGP